MNVLLKLEFLKLQRRSMYWICAAIAIFVSVNSLANLLFLDIDGYFSPITIFNRFTLNYCSSLTIPISILVFYAVGTEFEQRTLHKSLVMGVSKSDYFFSKLIGALGYTLIAVLFFLVLTFVYNNWLGYFTGVQLKSYVLAIGSIATYVMMMFIICLYFIFQFREAKKAMLLLYAYILFEYILNALVNKFYNFKLWFLPFSAIRAVFVDEQKNVNLLWENPVDTQLLIVLIGYAILFLVLSYTSFLKRDLR